MRAANRGSIGPSLDREGIPASNKGGAGVCCAVGGYVAGPLGQLNGREGAKRIDASCIDRLAVD